MIAMFLLQLYTAYAIAKRDSQTLYFLLYIIFFSLVKFDLLNNRLYSVIFKIQIKIIKRIKIKYFVGRLIKFAILIAICSHKKLFANTRRDLNAKQ